MPNSACLRNQKSAFPATKTAVVELKQTRAVAGKIQCIASPAPTRSKASLSIRCTEIHIYMPKNTEKEPKSFEIAMAELDGLVEKMEAGQLPLEESLAAYQRGTELLRYCEKVLTDAEQRIQVLTASAGSSPAGLRDFDE